MGFLLVCAVLMVCYEFFFCDHFIGYMDGKLYYQYLPEFFIEHNFSFYVKFPMGTALCELVFFLAGHLLTLMFAPRAASGYGGFYEYAVGFAGIFYFTVGMVLLFLTLKQLFSEKTAAKTGILLVLGTPLVLYGTKYASFSHIYTFAAGSLLLYLTVRIETQTTEKRKTHIRAFLIGAAAGLLFLIRNVNAVFLLIYLLYDFGDDKNFKAHIKSIFSKDRLPYHLSGGLVLVLPQLLYWKKVTGSFLLNTYAEESFSYLLRPKFYEVLFSDAKGYFIFTPLMILGILGFFFVKNLSVPGRATCGILMAAEVGVLIWNLFQKRTKQENSWIQIEAWLILVFFGQPYQILSTFMMRTGMRIQDVWWLPIVTAVALYAFGTALTSCVFGGILRRTPRRQMTE